MGETAYYELDQNDAQKIKVSRIHTTYCNLNIKELLS